jgi:hypothetical protein
MSTFTVAGVSTHAEQGTKVRFANDMASRVKLLSKGGHAPLELVELPKPMTKAEACQYLLDVGGVFAQWNSVITETMGKKQDVKVAKPVKVKATKVVAPVKSKPVTPVAPAKKAKPVKVVKAKDEDFDIEEIKELAEATV